jgi:uncharacterized membrane protein (UPF0127 family)
VGDDRLDVLIADTPEERQTGLQGVEEIPGGADGMLFVYETSSEVHYFMLGVPIALDIWFFDPEGVLIGSTEMAPCPAEPCPTYSSPGPVSWVLETVAGVYGYDDGAVLSGAPNGESG